MRCWLIGTIRVRLRGWLNSRGIEVVVPARSSVQEVSGVFDAQRYCGRNVVEWVFRVVEVVAWFGD